MSEAQNMDKMELLFDDLEKPEAIVEAQYSSEATSEENKGQSHFARVGLFFSFDIVNSTMYKTMTGNWPVVIRGLLEDIRARVFKMQDLSSCNLWRVIGDEMVFVMMIDTKEELGLAVESIFEVTQKVSKLLKTGKFFETLEGQTIQRQDLELLKIQTPLSVKSAAWLAIINEKIESPYECIKFNYSASPQNQIITEYLGRDIDAGFRLKGYTQDRRLVVSFELAYILECLGKKKELYIMDYVRLKGVWNNSLYPIIWFHNAETAKNIYGNIDDKMHQYTFAGSFRYDETDDNRIVSQYFERGKKQKNRKHDVGKQGYILADSMYKVDTALKKIILDRNLQNKIAYFEKLLSKGILRIESKPYAEPLEVHCAVVCCNIHERKVMITHRGMYHSTNPGKWEFGCAKLASDKKMIDSIENYYKNTYGVEIELVVDKTRNEKQPVPLAVYELQSGNNLKKGVIFVAKVKNAIESDEFRAEKSHDKIKWIGEDEIDTYKNNAIQDFDNTLRTVFNNFNSYFE
ncbi:hypothetical protein [Anaerobutyricum hallii]|uniref:hypothetical protein n=1 Tax=Anaerobutyricum hallii TaxID=39488 RepID=UPI0035220E9A